MRTFLRDEQGQSSVEYILIMAIVVLLVITFTRKFLLPLSKKLGDALEKKIEDNFLKKDAMHQCASRSKTSAFGTST